jgi:hypothetical protein
MNSHGQSHLQVAASNGCCATLERLIARYCSNAQIPVEVVKAAAGNNRYSKEVMALLLNQQGADVVITEEVVKAAVDNYGNGKEVITFFLEQRETEVYEALVRINRDNSIESFGKYLFRV